MYGTGAFDVFLELLKATSCVNTTRATRLFCDVYNPQSKTYCKRLQVLCPEHSRDPKVRFFLKPLHPVLPCFTSHTHSFFSFLLSSFSFPVSFRSHPLLFNHLPRLPFCLLLTPLTYSHLPCCLCRCQLMRSVGVHLYEMSLSLQVTSAACPSASVIAITAGRSFGVQKWTWSACGCGTSWTSCLSRSVMFAQP